MTYQARGRTVFEVVVVRVSVALYDFLWRFVELVRLQCDQHPTLAFHSERIILTVVIEIQGRRDFTSTMSKCCAHAALSLVLIFRQLHSLRS